MFIFRDLDRHLELHKNMEQTLNNRMVSAVIDLLVTTWMLIIVMRAIKTVSFSNWLKFKTILMINLIKG